MTLADIGLYDITAVIPSFEPDANLLKVVKGLVEVGFKRLVLVDDGSGEEKKKYFKAAVREYPQCVLLTHPENFGKGRAIKTAISYIIENIGAGNGIVTVDGDNQHRAQDAASCAAALINNENALVLGCRSFSEKGIPIKSFLGNRLTALAFKLFCGITVSDTQTGLRGIPPKALESFLKLSGERFEYETNMLLCAHELGLEFIEIPIETIYIEQNRASHFNPIKDSIAIYRLILKFLWSGLASSGIDFLLFLLLNGLLYQIAPELRILIATAGARLCSSVFNYCINKTLVFKSRISGSKTLVKYYILCVLQAAASYGGVYLISRAMPDGVAKLIVDAALFIISFYIQREFVFAKSDKKQKLI